jgi:hypothetical protein
VQVGSLSSSSATQAHASPNPSASSTSPTTTPAAATAAETRSAKDRYSVCHAQRARQRLLLELEQQRRQQQWAAHQHYPVLPPPWLPAHWGEPSSWAPELPPLRLPYDTAGPHPPPVPGSAPPLWPLPPGDGFNVPAFEGPYGLG